jgi:hypothetical protein
MDHRAVFGGRLGYSPGRHFIFPADCNIGLTKKKGLL